MPKTPVADRAAAGRPGSTTRRAAPAKGRTRATPQNRATPQTRATPQKRPVRTAPAGRGPRGGDGRVAARPGRPTPPRPGTTAPAPFRAAPAEVPAAGEREGFLDAVRAIATLRVILWHAFGAAAITYVVAAMPAMFFVTGSLLAKSLDRRGARAVLADRFRRLLVPLWAFGAVAWTAMAVAAARTDTPLPWSRALAWLLPLADPGGSAWEGGWMSSHLWYLRALTWLLLLAPLLRRATRALGGTALVVPAVIVLALDRLTGSLRSAAEVRVAWLLGDLALYGLFLMLGFLHREGALRAMTPRRWLAVAAVSTAAAACWGLTQPVPLGVVNNSHPMHLFVGAAWLAAGLAGQRALAGLARHRVAGAVIRAIGRRALTVYLWHTVAIIAGVHVLEATGVTGPVARPAGLLALTAVGTAAAVVLFGWVEDLAARRPRTGRGPARPGWRRAGAVAAAVAVSVGVLAVGARPASRPAGAGEVASAAPPRPPVPSQQPPAPVFEPEAPATEAPPAEAAAGPDATAGPVPETSVATPANAPASRVPPRAVTVPTTVAVPTVVSRLDALLRDWVRDANVGGAIAGVAVADDLVWTGATGTRSGTGARMRVGDRIDAASVTKLLTATLVYRLADAGQIALDRPVPRLDALPGFPYERGITVDQLLRHSSGLANYREIPEFRTDPDLFADPVTAVETVLRHPLLFPPGAGYEYSSTNYLVLGLLLEQVSGRSYDDLLAQYLLRPLGLTDTIHRAPEPGLPNGGTGGIATDVDDLVRMGIGIVRDHAGMSDASFARMTSIDRNTGAGAGAFGYCPCRIVSGVPQFFAYGHTGGTTVVAYAPAFDITIAVDVAGSLWEDGRFEALTSLFEAVEELVRGG